jgi:hypothetical protein
MDATTHARIPLAVSRAHDPQRAALELEEALRLPQTALSLFFCSPQFELDALAHELQGRFGNIPLIGCTTAGEITPEGYLDETITGAALPAGDFHVATVLIENLDRFAVSDAPRLCARLADQLGQSLGAITPQNAFGFLLIDGLSMREESVISAIYNSLGQIPIFGGSAGDGLNFKRTRIYADGAFRGNAAVFALIHTTRPFTVFKTQHFVATPQKMVVTGADPARRVVTEINGEPAAAAYADLVGVSIAELNPIVFATHPVMVRIGGADYVRAIQSAHPDGSLSFYCAIEEGLVLSLAESIDLVENLETLFRQVRGAVGEPELVIGCDCILRKLEMERRSLTEPANRVFKKNRVIGFATYGEQYHAMHISQTFTGVAIGAGKAPHA